MTQAVIRMVRNVILYLLVALSLVLSYMLWSGNLQEGSEIGFVQTPALPTATTPDIKHAIRPYLITIYTTDGQGHTVLRPGTDDYSYWTAELSRAHVYDPVTVSVLPAKMQMKVTFKFGILLTRPLAGKWLANFGGLLDGWQGRTMVLYKRPKDNVCYIGFIGDNKVLILKTDLNATTLFNQAAGDVVAAPYDKIGYGDHVSYIPRNLGMVQSVYAVRQPDTLPLVHTFFVNPQAITRIQQDANTVLWTDGSRAVQTDKATMELRYQDPNSTPVNLRNDPFMTALDFIHTHGGGAQNVIGFDPLGSLTVNTNVSSYTFTQYVSGFPILSNDASYNVDLAGGRVLEYDRPLWVLQDPVKQTTVEVMNKSELVKALKHIDPNDLITDLDVQLGYDLAPATPHPSQVSLTPVYYVVNQNGESWMLNAVSGMLMTGSGTS